MIRPHRAHRRQRGFTLIEMMTVLAIVAILTVGFASMASPGQGNPRTSSEEVSGMLQFARLRAESQRVIHRVRFESTQVVSIWESVVSAANPTPVVGFATPVQYALVQQLTLPGNAFLFAADPATLAGSGNVPVLNANLPFDITFKPDGSSTGGTVFFSDQSQATLSSPGFRVFVYKATGGALAREVW